MSNRPNKLFTHEEVLNMISAVNDLFDGSGQIFNQYHHEPAANSQATQERKSFTKPGLVRDVHYRGILSMEAAGDHLVAFTTCVAEPAKTLAPATCIRGLLESCALAAWFLDPTIDAQTRVRRCFAFRYTGFIQQIKLFQVEKRQSEIDQVRQRLLKVEQEALSLRYPQILNKKGDINGIAQTALGGMMLSICGGFRVEDADTSSWENGVGRTASCDRSADPVIFASI